jgi:hypothetical protein
LHGTLAIVAGHFGTLLVAKSYPDWMTDTGPQAESVTDTSGRPTNGASIGPTPAVAAIGLDGKGQVVWFFDSKGAAPTSDKTAAIPQLNPLSLPQLQAIKQQIDQLIKQGGAGPLTLPMNINLAQLTDINKQLEAFVQLASPGGVLAATNPTESC